MAREMKLAWSKELADSSTTGTGASGGRSRPGRSMSAMSEGEGSSADAQAALLVATGQVGQATGQAGQTGATSGSTGTAGGDGDSEGMREEAVETAELTCQGILEAIETILDCCEQNAQVLHTLEPIIMNLIVTSLRIQISGTPLLSEP